MSAFQIRRGTVEDAAIIAHHRVAMFLDIGSADHTTAEPLRRASVAYLEDAMPRGEYHAWLAHAAEDRSQVVAGAGVQERRVLPFPKRHEDGRRSWFEGRQAIVLNVYTEPEFRRRGIARALMLEVLAWARATRLDSLVLHGAPDGRALYESLGFSQTNEMRYQGDFF